MRLLLCLGLLLASILQAQEVDLSILDEPDRLYLKNGRGFIGEARGVEDGRLVFEGESAAGSVEYSFSKDEVGRLDFPGTDLVVVANTLMSEGRYAEAVGITEPLYKQRARFFAFMPESEVAWFQQLVEGAYLAGDYYLAVGVSRNVRPFMTDARIRRQLHDRELLAHYHLPLLEKTKSLADEWIATWEPYGESALGWYVLGQMALDNEEPKEALWYCLKPIVFSSQYQADFLGHAYALAIVASVQLEDYQGAELLLEEMQERALAWPQEKKLELFRIYYDEGIPEPETSG